MNDCLQGRGERVFSKSEQLRKINRVLSILGRLRRAEIVHGAVTGTRSFIRKNWRNILQQWHVLAGGGRVFESKRASYEFALVINPIGVIFRAIT